MFSRIAYVLRETFGSLKRNLTLTLASLLTVIVSLVLVGLALVIRSAVDNSLSRWSGNVEFIVFMQPDAPQEAIDAVGNDLNNNPQVDKATFFNKEQAYEEFKRLFPDSSDLVGAITADKLPTSYRVKPKTTDTEVIKALGNQFAKKPGVYRVTFAEDAVKWLRVISGFMRRGLFIAAVVLGLAAVMLILNTIQTAMFARRREIEVMKLVGATNWFIRVPFMLEGLIQGLLGAGVACAGIVGANTLWRRNVIDKLTIEDLKSLVVSSGEIRSTCILVLVIGMVVGAVGSGIAVGRFLDV